MWKRIKRVVRSNLGRLRDDPLSQGPRDLRALGENLATVRQQALLLQKDLRRLEDEEGALGARIRKALDANERPVALELASSLKHVREEKARVERQLAAARRVLDKAEGVQQRLERSGALERSGSAPSALGASALEEAAEETLARMARELAQGGADRAPSTEERSQEPDEERGRSAPREKSIGQDAVGHDTRRVASDKTIGADSGPTAVPAGEQAARSPRSKTIGPVDQPADPTDAPQVAPSQAPTPAQAPSPPVVHAPPTVAASAPDRLLDELERLARLREAGVLSAEEFDIAKRRVLGL